MAKNKHAPALYRAARHCKSAGQKTNQTTDDLSRLMNTLHGEWEGRSMDEFYYTHAPACRNLLTELSRGLEDLAGNLEKKAEEPDEQLP